MRSFLAVFVAFEVLIDEDERPGSVIRRGNGSEEGMKGNNIVKELASPGRITASTKLFCFAIVFASMLTMVMSS